MAVKLGFGRYLIQINGSELLTVEIKDGLNANDAIKRALRMYRDTGHKAVLSDCEIVAFIKIL